MHPNAALLHRFYAAFRARDAEAMAACYHPEIVFSDPVFGELRGGAARDMWRMLCAHGRDLVVEASDIRADDARGSARWVARYAFGRTKRPVTNRIQARFEFRDGLISRHEDTFDLWRWSRMALGPVGALLGWTSMLKGRIRRDARRGLDAFVARRK